MCLCYVGDIMSDNIKSKSIAWIFFSINVGDESKATCKLCDTVISRGSGKAGKFTTTNLLNHLMFKHSKELADERAKQPSSSTSRPKPALLQADIRTMVKSSRKWAKDDPKAKRMNRLIAEMMCIDNQPFDVVNDRGFRNLIAYSSPQYQLPSRPFFSDTEIPRLYDEEKEYLLAKLEKCESNYPFVSLTSDIWTEKYTLKSFLTITAHWCDEHFVRDWAVLTLQNLTESHTGQLISETCHAVLEEFKLSSKTFAMVRDGGSNMVAAFRNDEIHSIYCFIHKIQLIVSNHVLDQRSVRDAIARCKNFVTHMHKSTTASDEFQKIQTQLNQKVLRLVQDVCTRWNSTFYLIERCLKLKAAIMVYNARFPSTGRDIRTSDWECLSKIVKILQPFEEATREASSRSSSLSMVIPTVLGLQTFLEDAITPNVDNNDEFPGIKTTLKAMLDDLIVRFQVEIEDKVHVIATFLDPRYKLTCQSPSTSLNLVKLYILEDYHKTINDESPATPVQDSTQNPTPAPVKALSLKDYRKRLKLSSSSTSRNNDLGSAYSSSAETSLKEEIISYNSLSPLDDDADPLSYWKSSGFPMLSKLARTYLAIPPSSVESERTFSLSGNIYQPKRNRLVPEKAGMLLFVGSNLKIRRKLEDAIEIE